MIPLKDIKCTIREYNSLPVDIWGFESKLYVFLDSYGMNGETRLEKPFLLGEGQFVNVTVHSLNGKPLRNSEVFNSKEIQFRINWRKHSESDEDKNWFRIDNDYKERMLHFHCEDENHNFKDHQPMLFSGTVSQLISDACDKAKKLLHEKYSELEVKDSDGFQGFAGRDLN